MKHKNLQEYVDIVGNTGDIMTMNGGYNDCIVGVISKFGGEQVVAYDIEKVLTRLRERDGMSEIEAIEFFEFNMLGAWMGDHTPMFIATLTEQHLEPADGMPFKAEKNNNSE
jgi:hypothetical protein